jgi:hypothetical protein
LKINEWTNKTVATSYTLDVQLAAGNHQITVEYYHIDGPAEVRLNWARMISPCSQTVAEARWKGEYFNNTNLAGIPVMTRDDGANALDLNFGGASPNPNCAVFAERFSARWTSRVNFAAGRYRFFVGGDDGVRLLINGAPKLDKWQDQGYTIYTTDVDLTANNHTITLEFYDNGLDARASVSWLPAPPDPPSNLLASAASITQINLSWADNSNNEGGFKIERWNGSSYSQINTVGANVTTYADSGLSPSTTYHYRVRASNIGGDSGYSNESSATTLSCNNSLSPTGKILEYQGGSFTVNVTAAPACAWTAVSSDWWITVTSGSSGTGNGVVHISVGEHGGAAQRSGSVTIAGKLFHVTQRPCPLLPSGQFCP